jgi:hypothetical protein
VTTRGTLWLVATFAAFIAVAFPLDRGTTEAQQAVLGLSAWAFLAVALRPQSREIRVQVIVLVGVATVLECVGSLVWGAYRYRLDNLPLYVPAGHGLFYLCALRVAALPAVVRNGRGIVVGVTTAATAWMGFGLIVPVVLGPWGVPDLLGFVTWAIFLRFILRGRYPLLYAVSFAMTTALELYGTSLGIWTWSVLLPGLWLPAGNPPTGIGAGYAAMDALTRRIVATARRRASPALRPSSSPADRAPGAAPSRA